MLWMLSDKSHYHTELHRFHTQALTEEEKLTMTSEVDRQAVLKVTKVRKCLKQDGSWIQKSQVDKETQLQQTRKSLVPVSWSSAESSPVSAPIESSTRSPASTSPSTTPQRTYIQSALKKFEALSSTENTPVRSNTYQAKSPHPHLEDSGSVLAEGAVREPTETPVEEALKTSEVTSEEKANETPADTPAEESLETTEVTPVEEAVEIPADTHVEKALVTSEIIPVEEAVEIPADTLVEKALVTSKIIPVEESVEIPADTPVEEAVEIPADTPVKEELNTFDASLDTPEEALETSKITYAAEIPTDTHVEVETFIITSVQESLKTSSDSPLKAALETSASATNPGPSSGALKEGRVNDLDNNLTEPSGQLTTNNTDDLVTTEIVHEVETTLELRHAEYQPTEAAKEYGEFSLQSALETPSIQSSGRSERVSDPATEELFTRPTNVRPRLTVNAKMCSLCKQPINGNVKITVEDPAICCHPECFKCDGCSKPLGDLLSSMYHHAGRVLCERCFDDIVFSP